MDDYVSREAARENACERCGKQGHCNRPEFCPVIYSINTIPAADVVARDCYNRILKENDVMREQLAQIGKKPGDSMGDVRPVRNARKIKFYNNPWTGRKFTTCAACHEKVGPHDKFCKHCGVKFEEVKTDEP